MAVHRFASLIVASHFNVPSEIFINNLSDCFAVTLWSRLLIFNKNLIPSMRRSVQFSHLWLFASSPMLHDRRLDAMPFYTRALFGVGTILCVCESVKRARKK